MNKQPLFDGIPKVRPAARPSNPVRMINGKFMRPMNGVDHLLFGVSHVVAPIQRRSLRTTE